MARPTKYDEQRAATIAQAVEVGLTYELAANSAGVSLSTFERWRKRYGGFDERITVAEGRGALANMARIQKAAKGNDDKDGDWRAAAWILEHRYPESYGRSVQQHEGAGGGPLTIILGERKDGPD